MFSPKDYVGFDVFRSHLESWAKKIHYAYLMETVDNDPSPAFWEDGKRRDCMHFRIVLFSQDRPLAEEPRESARWDEVNRLLIKDYFDLSVIFHCLFAKCMMNLDTLLTTADGNVMRPLTGDVQGARGI